MTHEWRSGALGRRAEEPRDPWRVEGGSGRGSWRARSVRALMRRYWWIALVLVTLNVVVGTQVSKPHQRVSIPYTYFRTQVQAGNVRSVVSMDDQIQGTLKRPLRYPPSTGKPTTRFVTRRPAFADDGLLGLLVGKHVQVSAKPHPQRALWQVLLISLAPSLVIVGLLLFLMRSTLGSGGLGGLGKSRARRYSPSSARTTFADVAGIEEAEDELIEVVDFLRDPERYRKLGAEIPKGVLLSGPPGTGKTLLARAVAGEADVPFFSLSASEFIEMVAGVGASRVRDLFSQAKENAPAIVFIDELDAIGRSRGNRVGGGGALDEREQTLNQILTEMDGFSGMEGVIVLAATNRPEILDSALLRPGRFDRRITVSPPDQTGRRKILEVHTRDVPLAADADVRRIAARTPGMVGADLKNLVNEAALAAARAGDHEVTLLHFNDALEKVVLGAERRITISDDERRRTAYHEAGHALLGMVEPGADPVRKVSIVPRGRALGITFQSPTTDRYGYTTEDLRGRIIGALGGRAAEETVFGNVTTGAESDLDQATAIARHMVGRWGMSKAVGLVSIYPRDGGPGVLADPEEAVSQATLELVDDEVRRIIGDAYTEALSRLTAHRSRLEALAEALLERETLDEDDAYAVAGFASPASLDGHANGHGNGHRPAQVARRDSPPRLID